VLSVTREREPEQLSKEVIPMMFEIIIVAFIVIGLASGVYLSHTLSKFEDRQTTKDWGDGNYD